MRAGGSTYISSGLGKPFQRNSTRRYDVDIGIRRGGQYQYSTVKRVGLISVYMASIDHPVEMIRMKVGYTYTSHVLYDRERQKGLKERGVPSYVIIQPSGFFSDMWEMLETGIIWSIGEGNYVLNPISLVDFGHFAIDKLLTVRSKDCDDSDNHDTTFPIVRAMFCMRQKHLGTGEFFFGNVDYIVPCGNDGSVPLQVQPTSKITPERDMQARARHSLYTY
eukprot:CFRG2314T1